jgi:nitrogen regulatory protein PII
VKTGTKADAAYTLSGSLPYSREGVKPIDKLTLTNTVTGTALKAGTDYTVSYANNTKVAAAGADKAPVMTIKLKGNYKGSIAVYFTITAADLKTAYDNGTVKVTASQVKFDEKKTDAAYEYKPTVKVTDGKKTLSAKKDYAVTYKNCSQEKVKAYLEALQKAGTGSVTAESLKPCAEITALDGTGYQKDTKITIDLSVYSEKLTTSNLYVAVSDETEKVTYTGSQVRPEVTVFYSADTKAVTDAKKEAQAAVKDGKTLTDEYLEQLRSKYNLTLLKETDAASLAAGGITSGYTLAYGTNTAAGKNKGTVTVTGTGIYGGSVTTKFTIKQRAVY